MENFDNMQWVDEFEKFKPINQESFELITDDGKANLMFTFYYIDLWSQEAINAHLALLIFSNQLCENVIYEGAISNAPIYAEEIDLLLTKHIKGLVNCVRIERNKVKQ